MTTSIQRETLAIKTQLESLIDHGTVILRPEEYASQFEIIGRGSYGKLSSGILASEAFIRESNEDLVALYNKFLTVSLLSSFDPTAGTSRLPQSVVALYARDLERIERQLHTFSADFYQLKNDAFVKDLAILFHRLIPVGAEYVLPDSSVPRSLLFKRGLGQFMRGIRACLYQCGGFSPYLELHAHVLALEDFTPRGWLETYGRLAELLELNPEYRGITSSSWFLDPTLGEISPHLSYLREVPLEHGATLLFSGYDTAAESGAIARSGSRRHLYEVGEYIPTVYTRIWPRKRLINWIKQCETGVPH